MEIILMAVMAAANIVCFVIGAKVGQAVSKGEELKLPEVRTERKAQMSIEDSRNAALLHNINSYNGTPNGQRDIP